MNSCERFERKFLGFTQSLWIGAVHLGADGLKSVFTNLFILLDMPFSIEVMFPKGTRVGIGLVIPFAIGTLERMRTGFALLSF